MISNVHANFLVNVGGSASGDMINLNAFVKEKVDQKFGVQLKEETIFFIRNVTISIQIETIN